MGQSSFSEASYAATSLKMLEILAFKLSSVSVRLCDELIVWFCTQ
jgi:hypothetical protein